jgi:prepilin peptidase CpaA
VSDYQLFLLAAAITALVAAGIDLRTGHIPNGLTLGVLAVAPIAHGTATALRTHSASAAAVSLGASLLGATLSALLPLMMYRSLGLGGGDVKLFAAIGALTNAGVGLRAETYAFVFGMVWALLVVARSGRLASTFGNVATLVTGPLRRGADRREVPREQMTSLPFAPAIFAGTVLAAAICWRMR